MTTKKEDSKKPIAVRVHPINVGQGDAILLEVKYDKATPQGLNSGQSEKHLIDGGLGQIEPPRYYQNLQNTLDDHGCIVKKSGGNEAGTTLEDQTRKQVTMDSIIITHPDQDHCGGINRLLEDFTITCPITTTLASCLKVNHTREITGQAFSSQDEKNQVRHWFPPAYVGVDSIRYAYGRRHTNLSYSTVKIAVNSKLNLSGSQNNASSILTTVKIPGTGNNYKYDVVLTGDSNGDNINEKLVLTGQSVGVFQVPHHGSKYNLHLQYKKSSVEDFKIFYSSFDAHIYLISHGKSYDHPHREVITGILSAAVQNQRRPKCKIVVTATWFEASKIDETNISNWRDYVDIYHFKPDTPYVTLDPNDEKLHAGLQLFVKKVPERPVENFPTDQTPEREQSEGTQSSQGSIVPRRRLFKNKEKLCPFCKKRVSLTDIWYRCNNNKCPIKTHADCEEESRETLTFGREFRICIYCRTCKECNKPMGTVHASCHLCGSVVHKQCITNCKQTTKGYTCRICREQSL